MDYWRMDCIEIVCESQWLKRHGASIGLHSCDKWEVPLIDNDNDDDDDSHFHHTALVLFHSTNFH